VNNQVRYCAYLIHNVPPDGSAMAAIGPPIDQNGDDDGDDDANDAPRRWRVHEHHDVKQITVVDGVNITTGKRGSMDGHFQIMRVF
jgi:hypothetical protein